MSIVCGSVGVIGISKKSGIGGIKIGISRISIIDGIKEVRLIRCENVSARRIIVDFERSCDVGMV